MLQKLSTSVALKGLIHSIPNYPEEGVTFLDISPLLADPKGFAAVIDTMAEAFEGKIDAIVALESRGFLFGPTLAYRLKVPFTMARKKGKLPRKVVQTSYQREYGSLEVLELHVDALKSGSRVLVVDDVLATGGSALAAAKLVEDIGSSVVGYAFVIELLFLHGRSKLGEVQVQSLVQYD